jgi:hypothetical protein
VAQQVLGVPVRIGYPRGVSEMGDVYHPLYAGAVGLVYLAGHEVEKHKTQKTAAAVSRAPASWGIGGKMKQWFAEAF